MNYIATFHTHLGALQMHKKLIAEGDNTAVMAPVPRKLSASCGTCVRFSVPFDTRFANGDLDTVYELRDGEFLVVFENEDEE